MIFPVHPTRAAIRLCCALVLLGMLVPASALRVQTVSAAEAECADAATWTTPGAWADPQFVVDGPLNVRSGPGTDCAIQGILYDSDPAVVTGYAVERGGLLWVPVTTYLGDGFAWQDGLGYSESVAAPVSVPVLMYHRINDDPGPYEVSSWMLDAQLNWLASNGYESITPRDLEAFLDAGAPLPARPIILSIDDGFISSLGFASALAAYGFRGTYVLPNQAAWRLSDGDIYDLAQSGEVCGHTVDHADLASLTPDQQWWEIEMNREWLESITGRAISCFAYPYGSYDWATADIVAQTGFTVAFDAWGGPARLDDGSLDRWHVHRIDGASFASLDDFVAAIGG